MTPQNAITMLLVMAFIVFFNLCQRYESRLQIVYALMIIRTTDKPRRDLAMLFDLLTPILYALGKFSQRAKQRAMAADVLDIAWLDNRFTACYVKNDVPQKPYFNTTELETVVSWCEKHRGYIAVDEDVYGFLAEYPHIVARLYLA